MIRTRFFYLVFGLTTFFFSCVAAVMGLAGAGHAGFDWVHRSWARLLLAVAGVRVEVDGLEHLVTGRAQIIMANHQSYFDIWALMAGLPVSLRFITKKELAGIPILSGAMRAAGHVFIDRNRAHSAGDTIRAAGDRMRAEGLTLVMFPEGTRSPDGELGRFLRGSFGLAIETQAHVIPTAIRGEWRVFPPDGKRIHPGTISVRLAPSVSLEGMEIADRGALLSETRATIESLLSCDVSRVPGR